MPPSAGDPLGHYEIIAPLGAGGMGEVYRARDTRLGREVAVKVLPEAVATDHERLARVEREARVLGSLNHPNIAHLYGLEREDARTASGTAAPQDSRTASEPVVAHASRVQGADAESRSNADASHRPRAPSPFSNRRSQGLAGIMAPTFERGSEP